MKDVKLDVKVGGNWKGTMVLPDGSEKVWSGVYRELKKPDKLVMTLTDEQPAVEFETYTLTLKGQGKTTQMTLSQTGGHLSDEEYERAKAGTQSFMDSMEAKVLAADVRPGTRWVFLARSCRLSPPAPDRCSRPPPPPGAGRR